jgi:hypothetical protein
MHSFLNRHGGKLVLLAWGALAVLLLQHAPFGLEEQGAKALLMDWSIADQVASSVLTLGPPDLRALLYLPSGFLWPGNVLAARIFSVALMAGIAALMYQWRRREGQDEAALLSTGLLLIAPITLHLLNSLSAGVCLLGAIALAEVLDRNYRAESRAFGGWYFAQMLLCVFSISLHPAGLAYPLALLWHWRKTPLDRQHQKLFFVGIPLVAVLTLVMRLGWPGVVWWQNPVSGAAYAFWGSSVEEGLSAADWLTGVLMLIVALVVILHERRRLLSDLTGSALLLGVVIGGATGDEAWGFLLLALLLYAGFPWLLRPSASLARHGFIIQRGWLLLMLLVIGTIFMRADRADYELGINNQLSPQDQLINTFAEHMDALRQASEAAGKPMPRIRVASQWPARTMVACKCDALPLPPAARDPDSQLAMMRGVNYLMLLPSATRNLTLTENLAMLGNRLETVSIQPGGVILKIREQPEKTAPASP